MLPKKRSVQPEDTVTETSQNEITERKKPCGGCGEEEENRVLMTCGVISSGLTYVQLESQKVEGGAE